MGLFCSFAGSMRLELTSADVTAALRRINSMKIPVANVQVLEDFTVSFTVCRSDVAAIRSMASQKGEHIRICSRRGIFWTIHGLRNRPVLLAGLSLLLFLTFFVPSRVFFVRVEGNEQISTARILEAASEAGIRFGASRRKVRSEKMKNSLLAAVPQLQWAGVNTYGCTAVISVRDRSDEIKLSDDPTVSSIVASCDGVITSCTSTAGTMLCSSGQAVKKGQMLISGYTDCGLLVTAERAEGEIFARTKHELTVICPRQVLIRAMSERHETNFSLIIGKKRINFKKGSGISDGTCVKMSTEYQLMLPGGYRLPVVLVKETVSTCQTQLQTTAKESERSLSGFAADYLRGQMVALSIVDAKEDFLFDEEVCRLTGHYDCIEMIGRQQIGDCYGKTD